MKTLHAPFFSLLFILTIFLFNTSCAQSTPHIRTDIYSDKEIDNLLSQFYQTDDLEDTYPSQILMDALTKDFPKAKNVDWETDRALYEVDFEIGTTDYEALYDRSGHLLMYSYEVSTYSIPSAVKKTIKLYHENHHIDDAKRIYKGTQSGYLLTLENQHDMDTYVMVSDKGEMLGVWPENGVNKNHQNHK